MNETDAPKGPHPTPTAKEVKDNAASNFSQTSEPGTQGQDQQRNLTSEEAQHLCQCKHPPKRNLVVCIDGTSNQFGNQNSNVVELYSRLVKSTYQLTYYNSGIGTYVKDSKSYKGLKQSVHHTLDKAFAINFKTKVLKAYEWLSENYEPGDRIFLFGFSRGAYQARVISGMIEKVGLLHKGNNEQIEFAYDLYMQSIERGEKATKKQKKDLQRSAELCRRFKQTLSRRHVTVHFVGTWDTVSSIGIIKGASLPETTTGMTHVCTFRHALALDELRVKFLPEYAYGGAGPSESVDSEKSLGPKGDVKEVWFAGSHSDIGGGNTANLTLDHFGPSLRWMSYKAIKQGLKIEPHRDPWESLIPRSSMSFVYRIMEYLPISRLSYAGPYATTRWPPNLMRPRQIKPGQLIHESVFDNRLKKENYHPLATLYGDNIWDKELLNDRQIIEADPYSRAGDILRALKKSYAASDSKSREQQYHALAAVSSSSFGKQSIAEFPDSKSILTDALKIECRNQNIEIEGHDIIVTLINALDSFDPVLTNPSALIIGIDTYLNDNPTVEPHRECVEGASSIASLLMDTMGLPYDEIPILLNERATRNNILGSIRSLVTNDRLTVNDPIFIFFASRSMTSKEDTFALLPYDYSIYTPSTMVPNNSFRAIHKERSFSFIGQARNLPPLAMASNLITRITGIDALSKWSPDMEYSNANTNRYSFEEGTPIKYITAGVIDDILSEIPTEKREKITFILDCPNAEHFQGNFQSAGLSSKAFISAFRSQETTKGVSASRTSFAETLTRVFGERNRRKQSQNNG